MILIEFYFDIVQSLCIACLAQGDGRLVHPTIFLLQNFRFSEVPTHKYFEDP